MRNIPEHYKQQGIIIRYTLYLIRRCTYYIYTSSIQLYLSTISYTVLIPLYIIVYSYSINIG